jgi:mono/diheme cytochrome c family protein
VVAKSIFFLSLGLFTADLSYSVLQASPATAAGVYSADQAQRGKAGYAAKCASCHGNELDGNVPAPALNTNEFLGTYQTRPAAILFDKIQKTMPATSPGSMTRPETADIVAYILSENMYPVGNAEFPSDEDSLNKLPLPKPPAH